jgi:Ca-activated chloride channel family protein
MMISRPAVSAKGNLKRHSGEPNAMGISSFEVDLRAAGIAICLAVAAWLWQRFIRHDPAQIYMSTLAFIDSKKASWRQRLANLPKFLTLCAAIAFGLAFIDPRFYIERHLGDNQENPLPLATEGIAIYLVLDQSGSMQEPVRGQSQTKMDLLKDVTEDFVLGNSRKGLRGRSNDLIGLLAFARGTDLLVPLTLDHQEIAQALKQLKVVGNRNLDGTAIGYAIYKAANLLAATRAYARDRAGKGKAAYDIKSSVILLVTDGMQDPNPLDRETPWRHIDPLEAARYAKENNIRLYIVNVEPKLAAEQYSANLRQMTKAAEMTGGKFFMLSNGSDLAAIYSSIDKLEKSSMPIEESLRKQLGSLLDKDQLPNLYQRLSLFPYLIALGIICLSAALLFNTTWLRRTP